METITQTLDPNVSHTAVPAGPLNAVTRRRMAMREAARPLLIVALAALVLLCSGGAPALAEELCNAAPRNGASQSVTQLIAAGAGSVIVNTPEIVIPFPHGGPPPFANGNAVRILGATGSVTTDAGGSGKIAVKSYAVLLVSANTGTLLFARSAFPGNPWGNTATPSADGPTFFVNLDFNHLIRSIDFSGLDDLSSGIAIIGRAQISNNDLATAHNVTVSATALWETCSPKFDH